MALRQQSKSSPGHYGWPRGLHCSMRRNSHCNARPSSHQPTAKKRRNATERFWKVTSVTVPIVISAIALAVAGLSYQDQHDSGISAAIAEQESEANLVTAYEQDNGV